MSGRTELSRFAFIDGCRYEVRHAIEGTRNEGVLSNEGNELRVCLFFINERFSRLIDKFVNGCICRVFVGSSNRHAVCEVGS